MITKEKLVERKNMLDEKINSIEVLKIDLISFTTNEEQLEISYAVVKEILQGFGRIKLNCKSREK
ncbi:hypothetical protein [Clostridium sp.]|uniref:hypothetical protein n=1 Tax=Clostridium sp. TaxID=1506 RepID=UPI003216A5C9